MARHHSAWWVGGLISLVALAIGAWSIIGSNSDKVDRVVTLELAKHRSPDVGPGVTTNDEGAPPTPREEPVARTPVLAQHPDTPPCFATLLLHVHSSHGGGGVRGAKVMVSPQGQDEGASGRISFSTTDTEGLSRIEVPAGCFVRLAIFGTANYLGTSRLLEPLGAGTVLEVTVTLDDQLREIRGRVRSRVTGEPVPNAEIWVNGGTLPWSEMELAGTSGEDGRFSLELLLPVCTEIIARAEGFVDAKLSFCPEFREPLEFLLSKNGALLVQVIAPDFSARETVVFVYESAPGSGGIVEGPIQRVEVDEFGQAIIPSLPADVELSVVLRFRDAVVFEWGPIKLEAHKSTTLECSLELGGVVEGVVVDERGAPIAGVLVQAVPGQGSGSRCLAISDSPGGESVSGHEGEFLIQGLTYGEWLVGPAPGARVLMPDGSSLAPLPWGVHWLVAPGQRPSIRIKLTSGSYIRGSVLDPAGEPAISAHVTAIGSGGRPYANASVGSQGQFELGPLAGGEYLLEGTAWPEWAPSKRVTAASGDSGVVLRLVTGGSVTGLVSDSRGSPILGSKVRLQQVAKEGSYVEKVCPRGEFQFETIREGPYRIISTDSVGRIGISHEFLVSDSETNNVNVVMLPGARLGLVPRTREARGLYRIYADGVAINELYLSSSRTRYVVVPQRVVVEFVAPDLVGSEIEVKLDEGQSVLIDCPW